MLLLLLLLLLLDKGWMKFKTSKSKQGKRADDKTITESFGRNQRDKKKKRRKSKFRKNAKVRVAWIPEILGKRGTLQLTIEVG